MATAAASSPPSATERFDLSRLGLALLAPALAALAATVVASIVLLATGDNPLDVVSKMVEYGLRPASVVNILDRSTTYYLSAVAVAIGFRINLFNIGVDGQYRTAAMLAAYVGGALALPPVLHVGVILLTAMAVGAAWAGIAAVLRVTRGVSEVISTIMLNFIATGFVAFLLTEDRLAVRVAGSNNIGTRPIDPSGRVPGFSYPGATDRVFGLLVVAVLVGIGYAVLVNRTRFGFDLRATGLSSPAAVASGVNVKRMILVTMLLSGAVAGLVGMPQLLGGSYQYSLDFPAGLGFTGIAIALLGRNHPVGIAVGAVLWAFLDRSSQILEINDIPPEIVVILQGTIVISVVIAYEVVRRTTLRRTQAKVGERLQVEAPSTPDAVTA